MAVLTSTEIQASQNLVGFWQFAALNGLYVGVLDKDADNHRSALTFHRITDDRADRVRRIETDDVSIRAIDARTFGPDLVYVMEVNRGRALQSGRTPLAALLDASVAQVVFADVHDLGLSALQVEKVKLPSSELWNVADVLAPKRWLFSPRWVRGGPAEVVANSADGQAMIVAATTEAARAAVITNAAEPQVLDHKQHRYLAFTRYAVPYRPFWALNRYSGSKEPHAGPLLLAEDGAEAVDLSAKLGIGGVFGFSLAAGRDGAPWVFALRKIAAGTQLLAISQSGSKWVLVSEHLLDGPAERVSAEYVGEVWHIVWAARKSRGWVLRHTRWP